MYGGAAQTAPVGDFLAIPRAESDDWQMSSVEMSGSPQHLLADALWSLTVANALKIDDARDGKSDRL